MALLAKDKDIVVPGQVLAEGMDYLPANGTYRQGEDIRSNRLGLLKIEGKVIKSIPLSGVYVPQKHDVIIGRVMDILMSGWRMDLNSPYSAVLGLKDATYDFVSKSADLTKYFDLDDYAVVKVIQVTTQNLIDVTCKGPGLKKLKGGRILRVSPHKIPRIIGSKGSMIGMVKKATKCQIVAGQNGIIWINGEAEQEHIAYETILSIEARAHESGLTDKVQKELLDRTGVDVTKIPDEPEEQEEERERFRSDRPRGRDGRRGSPRLRRHDNKGDGQ